MNNDDYSEIFRLTAKEYVEANAAADILEELKSATLSQMILELGDMPISRAETRVKASEEWTNYIQKMVEARKTSNLLKVKMEYIRMKFMERQSEDATARAERRL
jgi:hypothetical protein